jgi:serine/threonine-protein kinase
MGTVYEAREIDFDIDRTVAIKVLQSHVPFAGHQMERRFREEIKILASMNHPNIVPVFNVGTFGHTPFLVMNYIRGETLTDRINRNRPLPEESIRPIAIQIAKAVSHIHKAGAIHRDIKCNNIMVGENLHVTLMDFGIARSLDAVTRITQSGQLVGTGPYLSPEQLDGKQDQRTDIYAFGVVLYEMAAGRLPFDSNSTSHLINLILHSPAEPLDQVRPDLSKGLCAIIHRCLEKDPDNRFSSMDEVQKALSPNSPPSSETQKEAPLPVDPPPPPLVPKPTPTPRMEQLQRRPKRRRGSKKSSPGKVKKGFWWVVKIGLILILLFLIMPHLSPSCAKKMDTYWGKAKKSIGIVMIKPGAGANQGNKAFD